MHRKRAELNTTLTTCTIGSENESLSIVFFLNYFGNSATSERKNNFSYDFYKFRLQRLNALIDCIGLLRYPLNTCFWIISAGAAACCCVLFYSGCQSHIKFSCIFNPSTPSGKLSSADVCWFIHTTETRAHFVLLFDAHTNKQYSIYGCFFFIATSFFWVALFVA